MKTHLTWQFFCGNMYCMREQIERAFRIYTDRYDSEDGKIYLKIYHTYKVAELCERIACSLGMNEDDVNLAWLLGMLHDTGRFEQIKRYNTFNDAKSVDHAELSADIIFAPDCPEARQYRQELYMAAKSLFDKEAKLIELAIRQHNKYRIPENISYREKCFCNILRDADKIDILRVNVETPFDVIYNVSMEELKNSPIAPAVYEAFNEGHAVLRSLKRYPLDNLVGHISLVYELVYRESRRITKEQGYLQKMLEFESDRSQTRLQLEAIKEKMLKFIDE